ncbi:MAG TPA: RusA family crossover junction endodeoxyribonuclease [Candidatus Acidoferrum sp.]|nr:RusA family crossover junction endodeoxyribonuclease [Candidatus Acidoferrum sp.]
MTAIRFTVYGRPEPQGSTRAFLPKGWNRAVITTDNAKLKPWRQQLSASAIGALAENGGELLAKPSGVRLAVCFYFERPASVSKRRVLPSVKPDIDKLTRALMDALTGTIFEDDAQVTDIVVAKRYGIPERAEVQVEIVEDTAYKPEIAKELPLFGEAS